MNGGIDWSWTLQVLVLVVLVSVVTGFAVIVLNSAIHTAVSRWKKDNNGKS